MSGQTTLFGNIVQASRELLTNKISPYFSDNDIEVCADLKIREGKLLVDCIEPCTPNGTVKISGKLVASCLATTGDDVEVYQSAPPSTGQVLVSTSATTAEWTDYESGGVVDASYTVLASHPELPDARVLTGSSNVSVVDGGPGNNATLDLTDTGVEAGSHPKRTATVDAKGRIVSMVLQECFPERLAKVELLAPDTNGGVLAPGGSHTYCIELGNEYDYVVLTQFNWVSKSPPDVIVPDLSLGNSSFLHSKFGNMLLVKQGVGTCRRIFKKGSEEYKDGNTVDIDAKYADTCSSAGVAMGYGVETTEVALNHPAAFGKKVQVSDVWLDGTELKITIENTDASSVDLNSLTALSTLPPSTNLVSENRWVAVAGKGIVKTSLSIQHDARYTLDCGNNWTNITGSEGQRVTGLCGWHDTGNEKYLFAFITYGARTYLYDTSLNTWQQRADPLFPYGLGSGQNHMTRQIFDYPFGGRPMTMKGNLGLIAACEEFKPKLFKCTNLFSADTLTTIFELNDMFSDENTDINARDDAAVNPRVWIVDDNTYYYSFQYVSTVATVARNRLIKTGNGGANWSELLGIQEFLNARAYSNWVSEDGNTILIVIFASDVYNVGSMRFNMSIDGGSNWLYDSGTWPLIASETQVNDRYYQPVNSNNPQNDRYAAGVVTLHRDPTGMLYVMYQNNSRFPVYKTSINNGTTWSSEQALTEWNDIASQLQSATPTALSYQNDSNDLLMAFGIYGYPTSTHSRLVKIATTTSFTDWGVWGM